MLAHGTTSRQVFQQTHLAVVYVKLDKPIQGICIFLRLCRFLGIRA